MGPHGHACLSGRARPRAGVRVDPELNAQSRMGHYRSLALVDYTDALVVPADAALETPVRARGSPALSRPRGPSPLRVPRSCPLNQVLLVQCGARSAAAPVQLCVSLACASRRSARARPGRLRALSCSGPPRWGRPTGRLRKWLRVLAGAKHLLPAPRVYHLSGWCRALCPVHRTHCTVNPAHPALCAGARLSSGRLVEPGVLVTRQPARLLHHPQPGRARPACGPMSRGRPLRRSKSLLCCGGALPRPCAKYARDFRWQDLGL